MTISDIVSFLNSKGFGKKGEFQDKGSRDSPICIFDG